MKYLSELTSGHWELIREKAAKICESDLFMENSLRCDYENIIILLTSLYLELLNEENDSAGMGKTLGLKDMFDRAKASAITYLVYEGYDYKGILTVLNAIKDTIRDIVFEEVRDIKELRQCLISNDECFCSLNAAFYSLWDELEDIRSIFKKIFDLTPFGIFLCEEDKFVYVNKVGECLSGYSNAELNSMSIMDLIHPDFSHILQVNAKSWSESHEIASEQYECKIKHKNGSDIWVGISVGQVYIGNKEWILGTAIDMTGQKNIENSLNRSERKYKTFFNLSPDMIFVIDMNNGNIIEANAVALNTLGISLEEIRRMKLNDFIDGENIYETEEIVSCLIHGSDIKGLNLMIKNVYGERFNIEVNCTPMIEKGEVTKVLCLARDITERKKLEELKRQAYESTKLLNETLENDKAKTEFFSNLSHEIRTPLNVILGTLQLMDMFYSSYTDTAGEKVKKYCKIMRQNCYRLMRMVNNLIDLSKLDAGFMKLDMKNYDIISIIAKIAASVKDYIESKGIEFSFESKIDSMIIACDPDKMERIILNLLSNAMKFTESGGKIHVNLWDNGSSLFIRVKDTGIGIPREKQDMIFKRFMQVDKSLSRNHNGSGIGLSLVKSLVELHGGSITLYSEVGVGSEFLIELPVRQISAEVGEQGSQLAADSKIEVINIEFSDIYSQM